MTKRLLLLASLAAPSLAAAQRATAAPYVSYAAAITTKADSVVGFLNAQVDDLANATAVSTLTAGATRMKRLTSEFAAYEPPSDLTSLHAELVNTLKLITTNADHAATLMQTALNTSNSDEARTAAATAAQKELSSLQSALTSYQELRVRAGGTLAAHGATLPPGRH